MEVMAAQVNPLWVKICKTEYESFYMYEGCRERQNQSTMLYECDGNINLIKKLFIFYWIECCLLWF